MLRQRAPVLRMTVRLLSVPPLASCTFNQAAFGCVAGTSLSARCRFMMSTS
jgi:hypothetical protein